MIKTILVFYFLTVTICVFSQYSKGDILIPDTLLAHASVSLCVRDAENGEVIITYNANTSLTPASVMKLITTAAALELLGPQYTFKTTIGYTGSIDRQSGILRGNIIIHGGGDPALGSKYFSDHYKDFLTGWVNEISNLGIRTIEGRVITDDSHYDYLPVPAKWLWEDAGNYYGAGVYGLSMYDNTYEIHLQTYGEGTHAVIKEINPVQCRYDLINRLISSGTKDKGYVFSAPYSRSGWLEGSIPADREDFVLKASITDPPLLIAQLMTEKITEAGISISENPSTTRIEMKSTSEEVIPIATLNSPPLADITSIINHESVNLFAEHLLKELGKKFKNSGSTNSGIEVVKEFLTNAGVKTDGFFLEDGSGVSPLNSINTKELTNLLFYMKRRGKFFPEYLASFPDAGREGTLKNYFRDPVFDSRLKAKSGSMTRVRSFAGYIVTKSGKNMIFSIIVNNYSGNTSDIITGIEETIKKIVLN